MKIAKKLGAAALAASLAAASIMPVSAASFTAPSQTGVAAPIILAASGDWRRGDRNDGPRYRGYKGSREYRRGHQQRDGWWFPLAAFGLGLGVGTTMAPRASGNAHVDWCYSRYQSYRVWDNSYQPFNGPRRACYSPYG